MFKAGEAISILPLSVNFSPSPERNSAMTTSSRLGAFVRLSLASALAACLLWPGTTAPVNQLKTSSTAPPLPELRGRAAVEHLKREGIYASLAEAVKASLYKAEALPSGDAYRFSNPAQGLRATFTPSGARVASSRGGRELVIKPIGYGYGRSGYGRSGYGRRMTLLDSQKIVARGNRIEHEYALKESAFRNPQSAIQEWFVNTEAGIEHGFTLPERPPAGRIGDEALRVEMEVGGDFEPRLDAARPAVTFACECGAGKLTYDKLKVYDARGREAPARFELEGKRLAVVVEDGEAEYPLTIDPTLALQDSRRFTPQAKLIDSEGATSDSFGNSVAISGNTAVAGAPFDDTDAGVMQVGAVFVFTRSGTTWRQQAELTASDGEANDFFGSSVAIDGDTLVAGAPGADGFKGAAYVFTRSDTDWTEQQILAISDGAAEDQFGISVAIDADTLVAGAPGADGRKGAAYVFMRSEADFPLQQKLTATNSEPIGSFGSSVAIDGNTVVVGAPFGFFDVGFFEGTAYVFERSGADWTQQAILTHGAGESFVTFGVSVAIDVDTVVVGADVGDISGIGAAFVFTRSGKTWPEQAKLMANDGAFFDFFGSSVAIDVNTLVVGAIGADGVAADSGAAYVFTRSGTTWTQRQKLTASDGEAEDSFGASVAIEGDTLVAGAPRDDAKGAAFVFVRCPPITVNPETLPTGTVGTAYSQTLTATGSPGPFTFSFSGALPPGLTLSQAGVISGTPTAAGSFSFTVQALDNNTGCTGTRPYTLVISCPTITVNPATLPNGTVGAAFSQTLTATGSPGPFTFSVSAPRPPGLPLSPAGVISGTPTAAGSFSFTVQALDNNTGCPGTRSFTLVIATPPSAVVAVEDHDHNGRNAALAGVAAGAAGFFAGRALAPGGPRRGRFTVVPAAPALPGCVSGQPCSMRFSTSDGTSPHNFIVKGAPPPGLTLDSNGNLSGTPTATGAYSFSVAVTDARNCSSERPYTLVVNQSSTSATGNPDAAPAGSALDINPDTLPTGTAGLAYIQTLVASGVAMPFRFSVAGGSLPAGLPP